MSSPTYEEVLALIANNLPDNNRQTISPALHRQVETALLNFARNGGLIPFDVTIPSAAVLTSFTTPVEIVPNPGAGKIAKLVECVQIIDFNSVAYATNVGVGLAYTASIPSSIGEASIAVVADDYFDMALNIASFVGTELKANDSISFHTTAGNPTAGNSPIRFKGFYRIIDL